MNTNTVAEALARTEHMQNEGDGPVGVMVDVATLQKMMLIIEICDASLRRRGRTTIKTGGSLRARGILRIAREMRKARTDWKKFLEESSKEVEA